MRIEAQIKHAERKKEKAEQELEKLRQTEDEQKRKLKSLQADLETVTKAANAAQGTSSDILICLTTDGHLEAQRKAAQHNLSLSEESLDEYRRLCVDPHISSTSVHIDGLCGN